MVAIGIRTLIRARPRARQRPEPEIDFARLVGPEGWARLPSAVRRRFAHAPTTAAVSRYVGVMEKVECSWAGFLLAQICRLIGTPFAPFPGNDVPVSITLSAPRQGRGVVWDREYDYPDHRRFLVRSTKRMTDDGRLLECVGGGFGMRLEVFERDHALHFRSLRYFWRCGPIDLPLPRLVSPGTAHVVHVDLGGGWFRFVMTVRHDWLGTIFHQDGVFRAEENAP